MYKTRSSFVVSVMGVVALFLLLSVALAVPVWAGFQEGGDRMVNTQWTDGGWGWPISTPPTYNNIQEPCIDGLSNAYLRTLDAGQLSALSLAGAKLLAKTNNFSPSDGNAAVYLDQVFGGSTYKDYVKANFYNKLAAGTYNKNGAGTLYDTTSYINKIVTDRGAGQANLAAWDIGNGLAAAARIGADTAPWIVATEARINNLSYANADYYWEVIGFAGGLYGLASVHDNFTPVAGDYAGIVGLNGLAEQLAAYQIPSTGGFSWDAQNVLDTYEDLQTTAYALLALAKVNNPSTSAAITDTVSFLWANQLPTGGWNTAPTDPCNQTNPYCQEFAEVNGETLWALATQPNSAPVAAFALGSPSANGWTISVTDNSTDVDGNLRGSSAITVKWGDGATSHTTKGGTVTHTYTVASGYVITLTATDAAGLSNTTSAPVNISLGTVSGTVKVGVTPVNLAKVTITAGGVTKTAYTNVTGNYTIANVKPGTGLSMTASKGSTIYYNVPLGPSVPVTLNSGPNTVNFTP